MLALKALATAHQLKKEAASLDALGREMDATAAADVESAKRAVEAGRRSVQGELAGSSHNNQQSAMAAAAAGAARAEREEKQQSAAASALQQEADRYRHLCECVCV